VLDATDSREGDGARTPVPFSLSYSPGCVEDVSVLKDSLGTWSPPGFGAQAQRIGPVRAPFMVAICSMSTLSTGGGFPGTLVNKLACSPRAPACHLC
jgi:hypothetical protein